LHKFFEEKKIKIGGATEGHKGHDIHSTIVLMTTRTKEMLTFGGHFQRDEHFVFQKAHDSFLLCKRTYKYTKK
jgi:hypothetical protein